MPVLAGWITGEQVAPEIIDQTLITMGEVLGRYGGEPGRTVQPGAGLITYADPAYAMRHNYEPPVLDWVPDRRTLVYRRPLSGMHTLYFIENWPAEGNLLFASEVKALFAVGVPRRLNLAALDTLRRYGFIPAPWTIFKDIQVVPAGYILRWQRSKLVVNQAVDYHFDTPLPTQDADTYIATQLQEAVAAQLPPHEQLLSLNSGSHASTLATLLATQEMSSPFMVASIGYTKSINGKAWAAAQRVAAACEQPFLAVIGVDQPEFWLAALTALEAPCTSTRELALHQLLHTAAVETGARVAISGLGAHILCPPLTQGPETTTSSEPADDVLARYQTSLMGRLDRPTPSLWSPDAARALAEAEAWETTLHARKLARQADKFTTVAQQQLYLDLRLRLPDLHVAPLQQLAQQERLVVRSPYLAPHATEALAQLSYAGTADTAHILTRLVQHSLPDAPQEPVTLPLTIPTRSFASMTDSELLQQILAPEALQQTGIFHPDTVASLLKRTKGKNPSPALLLVFTTQLLYQLFNLEGWSV